MAPMRVFGDLNLGVDLIWMVDMKQFLRPSYLFNEPPKLNPFLAVLNNRDREKNIFKPHPLIMGKIPKPEISSSVIVGKKIQREDLPIAL